MAYNNYYPMNYQPQYYSNYQQPMQQCQQYQQQVPQQTQQQSNNVGVNWVQGEAGARSWLVAPNSTVLLMDSEADRFYLKATDASGMPLPLRIFDYTERRLDVSKNDLNDPKVKSPDYATKDDLNALQQVTHDELVELKKQIKEEVAEMFSGGTVSFTTKSKKKESANE